MPRLKQLRLRSDPEVQEIVDRFTYRSPSDEQKVALAEVHTKIVDLVTWLATYLPNSRDRAVALTGLEDVRMKINKAIVFSELEFDEDTSE